MEQRKFQRFTDQSVVTFGNAIAQGEGRLDNLSLGGAAILSDVAIPKGSYLMLSINLGSEANAIDIELAPVRWVEEGSFGVEFIRMAPDSQRRLREYINTLVKTSEAA